MMKLVKLNKKKKCMNLKIINNNNNNKIIIIIISSSNNNMFNNNNKPKRNHPMLCLELNVLRLLNPTLIVEIVQKIKNLISLILHLWKTVLMQHLLINMLWSILKLEFWKPLSHLLEKAFLI